MFVEIKNISSQPTHTSLVLEPCMDERRPVEANAETSLIGGLGNYLGISHQAIDRIGRREKCYLALAKFLFYSSRPLSVLISFVLPHLGIGAEIVNFVVQAAWIILWAVICIAAIYFIFSLVACLLGGSVGAPRLR